MLMVFFSSRISPLTSTVIFFDRSPLATAVVTSAMLRTWSVRLPASELTLSVRSFQVPDTPLHLGLAAELALGADLLGDARDLGGERAELIDHRVDGVLQLEDLALHVDGDLLRQVAVGDRGRDLGDVAHLVGQVAGEQVDVVGEVLPGAGDAGHLGLPAELSFGADVRATLRDLLRRRCRASSVMPLIVSASAGDLALGVDGDLLRQVAVGDRGDDLGRCRAPAWSGSRP